MRLPRVRFKLGQVMVALVFVSLGLAIFARRQRLKTLVVNQEITLKTAEANFLNAVLARENAEYAFIAYLNIDKQRFPNRTGSCPIQKKPNSSNDCGILGSPRKTDGHSSFFARTRLIRTILRHWQENA
jgi:hypothetical protein